MKKRDLWKSDDQISDSDEGQSLSKPVPIARNPSEQLFHQNFEKYIRYLNQFGKEAEQIQQRVFGDGIWYVNHPLIQTSQINYEKNVGIFDMINLTQDKSNEANWVKKVLVSFTFMDNEIQKVIAILENQLYDALVMYGEEASGKVQEESPQMMTARMMGVYKKIYELVRKLMAYIQNIVVQLHSMINKKNTVWKQLFRYADFTTYLDLMGRALRAIYVIDCIVANNGYIVAHWDAYKKMIKLAKNQPQKFGSKSTSLKKLQKVMNRYENTILSGGCMITITQITYDQTLEKMNSPLGRIEKNKELREVFEKYFVSKWKDINQHMGTKFDMDEDRKLLELMCTYTLFRKLFPGQELKNFWKDLWFMQKRMPIIEAHSFVFVYVCVFMKNVCPLQRGKPSSIDPKDERNFIAQYVSSLGPFLIQQISSQYTKFCVWLSRMESVATSNTLLRNVDRKKQGLSAVQERVDNRIALFCQGLSHIMKLYKLIYICFMLHLNEERPITKGLLGKLVLAIETVKATAYILRKKAEAFDTMILSKTLAKDISKILQNNKEKVRSQRSKDHLHKVIIYQTILDQLESPLSELKITWIKHALGTLSEWVITDLEFKQIRQLLRRLEIVAYNRILVQRFQNLGFLYYAKDILPQIFQLKRQNPQTCKRLQFLFDGFEDASRLLLRCQHLQKHEQLFEQFKKTMVGSFEQNYMIPLKRNLQDFLRVSTSSMLIQKLQGVNPWQGEMNDLIRMVQFQKLRIFDGTIDLKFEISESFNSSFYNLNILNMHDMQTYEMMRVMGNHIFDLKLHDVFLPNYTIERDKFDILTVVRNIPTFVTSYKYNMLNQRFLELTSQNKIINCISIQQLADSIRTHGLGILSTTVNAFYKFMITKVTAFSKFLFMEDVQNCLNRDRKWFKEYSDKDQYPGYYPYQRAQHLYNQIKKLGKFQEDTNLLDKMRQIITTVGNSLGFIRLIRSASLHTESGNIQYLPNKSEISQTFEEIAGKSTLGQTSKSACRELDQVLKSFQQKFSQKIDYLNLMVKAFSKIVTSESSKHLKNFYLLIPALSINYVQFVIRGKEQINKKITTKAFIYDDGFIVGMAYFLTLLKQNQNYKTLHWDQATKYYFTETRKESKAATIDTANHSAKFIQDLNIQKQLVIKKIQNMDEEYSFFNFNLISAKILFKSKSEQNKQIPKSPPSGDAQ